MPVININFKSKNPSACQQSTNNQNMDVQQNCECIIANTVRNKKVNVYCKEGMSLNYLTLNSPWKANSH